MKFLKRFPEGKHEQIRQLIFMAQLSGLSGKDLVSIGGWIDRNKKNDEYRANKDRINELIKQGIILPIGQDSKEQIVNRFKYKSAAGDYNFVSNGWSHWTCTSMKTKVKQNFIPGSYSWPGHIHWNYRYFYNCVLDIVDKKIQLNF